MGNKQTHSQSETEPETRSDQDNSRLPPTGRRVKDDTGEEADDHEVAEVPPPMRPISSMPAPDEASIKRVRICI